MARWSKAELCSSGSLVSLRECGELVATQAKMLKASEQEIDSADLGKPIGSQRHGRPLESCLLLIHFLLSMAEKTGNPSLLAE